MPDGQSLSPKLQEAEEVMTFPEAMAEVVKGKKVTRVEWKDVNEYGIFADGWLTIHTQGAFHKWLVNDGDLLATDWKVC